MYLLRVRLAEYGCTGCQARCIPFLDIVRLGCKSETTVADIGIYVHRWCCLAFGHFSIEAFRMRKVKVGRHVEYQRLSAFQMLLDIEI